MRARTKSLSMSCTGAKLRFWSGLILSRPPPPVVDGSPPPPPPVLLHLTADVRTAGVLSELEATLVAAVTCPTSNDMTSENWIAGQVLPLQRESWPATWR